MASLTAANSAFSLAIANVFPSPQPMQGYDTDDAFASEAVELTETKMGVDGKLSSGFVFNPYNMTLTLQADSPSLDVIYAWKLYLQTQREVVRASGSIILPAIGKKFTLSNGNLISLPPFPDVKKLLQAVRINLRWESITSEPI